MLSQHCSGKYASTLINIEDVNVYIDDVGLFLLQTVEIVANLYCNGERNISIITTLGDCQGMLLMQTFMFLLTLKT